MIQASLSHISAGPSAPRAVPLADSGQAAPVSGRFALGLNALLDGGGLVTAEASVATQKTAALPPAGPVETAASDLGMVETGRVDFGTVDTGTVAIGTPDVGAPDVGALDVGPMGTGMVTDDPVADDSMTDGAVAGTVEHRPFLAVGDDLGDEIADAEVSLPATDPVPPGPRMPGAADVVPVALPVVAPPAFGQGGHGTPPDDAVAPALAPVPETATIPAGVGSARLQASETKDGVRGEGLAPARTAQIGSATDKAKGAGEPALPGVAPTVPADAAAPAPAPLQPFSTAVPAAPVLVVAAPTMAAPIPSAPPVVNMTQGDWPATVAGASIAALTPEGGTMVLELTPEDLGALRVTLTLEGDVAQVRFQTDTPEAARLLAEGERQLSAEFARSGLTLTGHEARSDTAGRDAGREGGARASSPAQSAPEAETDVTQTLLYPVAGGVVNLIA